MNQCLRCPACSSENVVFSEKRSVNVCNDCGHNWAGEKSVGPLRIFLSYGHDHNEELVRRIRADLEKRGHDVWFDRSEIKFGDDWRRSITEGITDSHQFVSFLSKHSTRDPGVCLDEIAIAIGAKGGNIQTILVESEQEAKPPATISHIQWLDMHDWKEWRAKGEAAWEEWYQAKFAEIVAVSETVIGGGRERHLIVIDALDEAGSASAQGEAGRNPLVELLARHAPRLPDWLGLVVTSRPEKVHRIRNELERRGHIPLLFFLKCLEVDDARLLELVRDENSTARTGHSMRGSKNSFAA